MYEKNNFIRAEKRATEKKFRDIMKKRNYIIPIKKQEEKELQFYFMGTKKHIRIVEENLSR